MLLNRLFIIILPVLSTALSLRDRTNSLLDGNTDIRRRANNGYQDNYSPLQGTRFFFGYNEDGTRSKRGLDEELDEEKYIDHTKRKEVTTTDGMVVTYGPANLDDVQRKVKRDTVTRGGMTITFGPAIEDGNVEKRSIISKLFRRDRSDYISSCGPTTGWMPRLNNSINFRDGSATQWGYWDAANSFCSRVSMDSMANPLIIPAKRRADSAIIYEDEYAKRGARVMLNGKVPGEVQCK